MHALDQFARQMPAQGWSLDELAAAANALLPEFLPIAEHRPGSAGKVREQVNSRLVRHYASLGLLDENAREGREARYGFRHLLQLLLVRRFLVEGYPAAVIANLIAGKTDEELRALLQGGASVSATPTNPALDFLARVRRRSGLREPVASSPPTVSSVPAAPPPTPAPTRAWNRLELLPGLEIHVREDCRLPVSPHESARLSQLFLDALQNIARANSGSARRPRSS